MSSIIPMLTGGGKAQTSSKPIDMQAAAFTALRNPFAGVLGGQLSGGPSGFLSTQFPRMDIAPMGGAEIAALNDAFAQTLDPTRRALLGETLSGGFLPGGGGQNPFLNAAILAAQEPTREALEHLITRTMPGQFARAGHQPGGNSALELARARALESGGRALGDIATNISSAAFENERNRQTQALGFSQAEIDRAIANFQAQGLPRTLEQAGITGGIQAGQAALQNWLAFMQLIGGVTAPALGNVQQGTSENFGRGLFGSLFPQGIYNPAPR